MEMLKNIIESNGGLCFAPRDNRDDAVFIKGQDIFGLIKYKNIDKIYAIFNIPTIFGRETIISSIEREYDDVYANANCFSIIGAYPNKTSIDIENCNSESFIVEKYIKL